MKILTLWFILVLSFAGQAADVSLVVRPHTVVSTSHDLFLTDIIETKTISPEVSQILSKVKLTNGPSYGERHILSNSTISRLLRQSLKDLEAQVQYRLLIPRQVTIENQGFRLDTDQVEAALVAHWKSFCADCTFAISSLSLPKISAQPLPIDWKLQFDNRPPRGQFSIPLQIRSESGDVQSHWVQGMVRMQKSVPVAKRAIHFGERLTAEDIELKLQDITFSHDSATDYQQAIGQRVRRALRVGDVIWSNSLEKKMAARRGQSVKILIGSEGWSLSMSGVAQMDGQVGEMISVKNPKTQKILSGRLVSDNEVRVE